MLRCWTLYEDVQSTTELTTTGKIRSKSKTSKEHKADVTLMQKAEKEQKATNKISLKCVRSNVISILTGF